MTKLLKNCTVEKSLLTWVVFACVGNYVSIKQQVEKCPADANWSQHLYNRTNVINTLLGLFCVHLICSPRVYLDFLLVLKFTPTVQRLACMSMNLHGCLCLFVFISPVMEEHSLWPSQKLKWSILPKSGTQLSTISVNFSVSLTLFLFHHVWIHILSVELTQYML